MYYKRQCYYWEYSDWKNINTIDSDIIKLFQCQCYGERPALCASSTVGSCFPSFCFGKGLKGTWYITNPLLILRNVQSPLILKVHFDPPSMDGYFMAKLRELKPSQCFSLQDLMRNLMRELWPFHLIFFSSSLSSHAYSNFLVKIADYLLIKSWDNIEIN